LAEILALLACLSGEKFFLEGAENSRVPVLFAISHNHCESPMERAEGCKMCLSFSTAACYADVPAISCSLVTSSTLHIPPFEKHEDCFV